MAELTYYELLEVHPNASEEVIRAAYFRLAKVYHPDLRRHDQKNEDTEKFIEINRAYTVLCSPARRQVYDLDLRSRSPSAPPPPPPPEDSPPAAPREEGAASTWSAPKDTGRAYFKAEQLVDEERFQDAARLLTALVRIDSENPTYLSLAGYALAACGENLHRARDFCRRAAETEPYNAVYQARLGFVYLAAGLDSVAEKYFRAALELDPMQSLARQHVGGASKRRKGGLLGSLRSLLSR